MHQHWKESRQDARRERPCGVPGEARFYCVSFNHHSGSWTGSRRGVAKVEWHPSELYPRVGFVVINMTRPAERAVAFCNYHSMAQQWIEEGKNAMTRARLSSHRFAAHSVRLQLRALASSLATFLRTLALPRRLSSGRSRPSATGW